MLKGNTIFYITEKTQTENQQQFRNAFIITKKWISTKQNNIHQCRFSFAFREEILENKISMVYIHISKTIYHGVMFGFSRCQSKGYDHHQINHNWMYSVIAGAQKIPLHGTPSLSKSLYNFPVWHATKFSHFDFRSQNYISELKNFLLIIEVLLNEIFLKKIEKTKHKTRPVLKSSENIRYAAVHNV